MQLKSIATSILPPLLSLLLTLPALSGAQPAPETTQQHDARMQWWREARFGMFIHWGVYSVPAGEYNGRETKGLGEWIMNGLKIPVADYKQFATQFNPVKYDPEAWVRAAKAAGMKYIVVGAKHHDGFALFETKASDWNVVDATPYKKDLLKPLAAACRKEGIKLGFYYSQAQDWTNGGAAEGGRWDPAQKTDMDGYIDKVAIPQVRELLSNYGSDIPAVLWWDTPDDMNPERAGKLDRVVKELRPDLITNNRLGGNFPGDTKTPEQYVPAGGFPGQDWETCMTMNGSWGFKRNDQDWKSPETLVRTLIDSASKGGNYLLNVGPTAEGEIPQPSIERLRQIGAWTKINGEAIYGTTASPFHRLPWGRATKIVTVRGTTLYLHVFDWPQAGSLVVPGLETLPASVALLVSGQPLKASVRNGDLLIDVPVAQPDTIVTVLKLTFAAPPKITARLPRQSDDGTLHLGTGEGDVNNTSHHAVARLDSIKGIPTVVGWKNETITVSWQCELRTAGSYAVEADYDATEAGAADLIVNNRKAGELVFPANLQAGKAINLGTVKIAATGELELKIAPGQAWSPVALRGITLRPAATAVR